MAAAAHNLSRLTGRPCVGPRPFSDHVTERWPTGERWGFQRTPPKRPPREPRPYWPETHSSLIGLKACGEWRSFSPEAGTSSALLIGKFWVEIVEICPEIGLAKSGETYSDWSSYQISARGLACRTIKAEQERKLRAGHSEAATRLAGPVAPLPAAAPPSMAVPETRPNHTIYINNLNEKIKKDGEFSKETRLQAVSHGPLSSPASTSAAISFRAEEVPVCYLLPVWPDPGYPGVTEPENEGPSLCHL
ncbi:U1 small nuclear ribonucleoprotein A isoform X3 [Myotis lucifugus]|uniref:U1 small nuclear ribonucleoprotein A isoform X3 n=1 Tax=Myotis lucifugus TaxID=59463 RepID=UPI000CCC2D9B|nr:U1 small nuclear ribonucleoprotein A isoform X3 [Myotis lucifugus]